MNNKYFSVYENEFITFEDQQIDESTRTHGFIDGNYAELHKEIRNTINDQHLISIIVKKYKIDGNNAYIEEEINGFSKEIPGYLTSSCCKYSFDENGQKRLSERIITETRLHNDQLFSNTSTKTMLTFDENGTKIIKAELEESTTKGTTTEKISKRYEFENAVTLAELSSAIQNPANLLDIQEEQF